MRRKQVTAVLLSSILSLSACMPVTGISAWAAEDVIVEDSSGTIEEDASYEEDVPNEKEASAPAQDAAETEQVKEDDEQEAADAADAAAAGDEAASATVSEETGDNLTDGSQEEIVETDNTQDIAENAGSASQDSSQAIEEDSGDLTGQNAETGTEEEIEITAPGEVEVDKEDAGYSLIGPSDSDFANASPISAGDSVPVTVQEVNAAAFFKFIPEDDGMYTFYSCENDGDPIASLYNADGEEIAQSDDWGGSNFQIQQFFKGGETYYFQACCYGDGTGSFTVCLEKNSSWFLADRVGDSDRWITPNSEVTLAVSASSSSQISYQWFDKNDEAIQNANAETYTFTVTKETVGSYYCRITDEDENSKDVYFYVYADNSLHAYVEGTENTSIGLYFAPKTKADLSVTVSADEMDGLSCKWYKYWEEIEGETGTTYSIPSVTENAEYEFQVSDPYGNSRTVYFYVYVNHLQAYVFGTENTSSYQYYAPGSRADLSVTVSADDETELTCQWYKYQEDDDWGYMAAIEGETGKTYSIASVAEYEEYEFRVSDQYGNSRWVDFYVCPLDLSAGTHTIAPGETVAVNVEENKAWPVYQFVPTETAEYSLYSFGNTGYPYLEVLDGSMTRIASCDDSDDANFRMEMTLTAGQTYYFIARAFSRNGSASYSMRLEKEGSVQQEQNINAENMTLTFGSTGAVVVTGAQGALSYASSNPAIAAVDGSGNVTANGVGTATITITAAATGSYNAATKTITVTVNKANQTISASDLSLVYLQTGKVSVTGAQGALSYSSSNPAIAAVDASGNVTAKGAGTATVTITAAATGSYNAATKTITVTVNKANQTISASNLSLVYLQTGKVSVTGAQGALTYSSSNAAIASVDASGNVTAKGVGTATVTITAAATANYNQASTSVTVTVTAAKINANSVTLSDTTYTYSGKAKKPSVTVKYGNTTLTSGTDYDVTYSDNTNAGDAKVKVTAKGNYTGTVTKTFTINKASQTITGPKDTYKKTYGNKSFSLGATAKTSLTYKSNKPKVAAVTNKGTVAIKGAGTAKITITAAADDNYKIATKEVTVRVSKASSKITAKKTKTTIKKTVVNKKKQTFNPDISVTSKGALTCTISSVKYGQKSLALKDYQKIFTVDKTTGKITVKKNTVIKKGTYTLKMKITAKTTANYKSATTTAVITFTVK